MNVKVGDTAIVIKDTCPDNLGIICEVKEHLGTVQRGDRIWFNTWHVVSNGRPLVLDGKRALECGAPDEVLRPISGLPDAESIDEQVTKPVVQSVTEEVA